MYKCVSSRYAIRSVDPKYTPSLEGVIGVPNGAIALTFNKVRDSKGGRLSVCSIHT